MLRNRGLHIFVAEDENEGLMLIRKLISYIRRITLKKLRLPNVTILLTEKKIILMR